MRKAIFKSLNGIKSTPGPGQEKRRTLTESEWSLIQGEEMFVTGAYLQCQESLFFQNIQNIDDIEFCIKVVGDVPNSLKRVAHRFRATDLGLL